MNLKKTISLLLSAVLAAGSLIAAPVLPEDASLFAAPIHAEAAGAVSSGTTTSTPSEPLISYVIGTSTLYFKKPASGTQVKICGSTLPPSDGYLEIPESFTHQGKTYTITGVNAGAFQNQINLTSVYFKGHSLSDIGPFAFKGCTNMNSCIYYGAIQNIGNNAFENCKEMEFCTLQENAQEIGYNAFKNCIKLSSLMLYNVNVLRGSAFYGCKGLKTVSFNTSSPVSVIEYRAFGDCTNLKSISLPESVRVIEENAFQNCSSMEKAYIPDSVTEIRGYAFYNCTNLKTVMMSENIRSIASYAFYNCDAMKYFVCKKTNATIGSYAVGYHKENGAKVKNSGFVIWGCGGSAQNYAQNNGIQYKDVSAAPNYALERYRAYEWWNVNYESGWSHNKKYYFNNSHIAYDKDQKNGTKFNGICYGMAVVSALTSSGYLSVNDYATEYSNSSLNSIHNPSLNTISYVTTVWENCSETTQNDYSLNNSMFTQEALRYAEYITYGADAAVVSVTMQGEEFGHSMVCFGLEFKGNQSWNGMDDKDARLMIYDVNESQPMPERYIYVNLADGSWEWMGSTVFHDDYNPSKCYFTLKHSYDKMVDATRYNMTTSEFFEAIRNPQ